MLDKAVSFILSMSFPQLITIATLALTISLIAKFAKKLLKIAIPLAIAIVIVMKVTGA